MARSPCPHITTGRPAGQRRRRRRRGRRARRGAAPGTCPAANSLACRTSRTGRAVERVGGRPAGWTRSAARRRSRRRCRRRARRRAGRSRSCGPARAISAGSWSASRTMTSGVSGGDEPAEPGRERVPQRDRHRPRARARRRSRRPGARRRRRRRRRAARRTCAGVQRRSAAAPSTRRRAAAVDLAEPAEVRRVAAQRAQQRGDERVLVGARAAAGWWPARGRWCEVRSAPGGAEQNDPAPWVGHTATSSGSSARRCSERYWARASSSVRSGRPGRCGPRTPTISDPPVNTPSGAAPSSSRNDRCSSVCPGWPAPAGVSPPRSTSSPSRRPGAANSPVAGGRGEHRRRRRSAASCTRAGQEVGVQVGVGGERDPQPALRRRRARSARRSRLASTASARPSPRSTR